MFVSFQLSKLFELFLFCCCSNKWLFCQSHFIRTLSNKLSSEYKFRIKAKIFHNFYAEQIVFESNFALFFKKLFHSITSDSHIHRFNTKMCEHYCDDLETFNPEIEYQKFLKRKPIVQTAKLYEQLHTREKIKCPYNFKGYGVETDKNTMYRTCNSEYGYYAPNAYTIPTRYFPLSQKFSNELARCGMYRNFSLNTLMDRAYFWVDLWLAVYYRGI